MAGIIEAKAVISAEDRTGAAFDAIAAKMAKLGKGAKASAEVERLAKAVTRARDQMKAADDLLRRQEGFAAARTRFRETQAAVEGAARALKLAEKPTRALETALRRTRTEVSRANTEYERQAGALKDAKRVAEGLGIPLREIGRVQSANRSQIDATTAALNRQIKVERVAAEVRQLTRVRRAERLAAVEIAARRDGRRQSLLEPSDARAASARDIRDQVRVRRSAAERALDRDVRLARIDEWRNRRDLVPSGREVIGARRASRVEREAGEAARYAEQQRLAVAAGRPKLGDALVEGGLGLGIGSVLKTTFDKTIGAWSTMDEATRTQRAILDISPDQQRTLQEQALKIGQDTRFSNTDVVKGQTRIGSSLADHLKKPAVIKAIADNAKNYALAMGTTMDEGSQAILGRMLGMRYDMSTPDAAAASAKHAANRLVQFGKSSGADHHDIVGYTKFGAAAGHTAGFSEEFADAMAAQLRRIGYEGSMAGNFVRSAGTRLSVPTSKGLAALAASGLSHDDYVDPAKKLSVDNFETVIRQGFGKQLSPGQRAQLAKVFDDEDVVGKREEFVPAVSAILQETLAKRTKKGKVNAVDAEKIAKTADRFYTASSGAVDLERLMRDLIAKGLTPALAKYLFGSEHGARAQALDLPTLDKDIAAFRRTPDNRAENIGEQKLAGFYGALQQATGSVETFFMRLGQANDAPLTAGARAIDTLFTGLGKLPDPVLTFGSAVVSATAALVALKGATAIGAAAGVPGAAAAGGVLGSALRLVPRFTGYGGLALGGYGAANLIGGAMTGIGEISNGKFWTPRDQAAIDDLSRQKAEAEAQIAGIEGRMHPSRRGEPNADLDRLRAQIAALKNRIDAATVTFADALPGGAPGQGQATRMFGPGGHLPQLDRPWDRSAPPPVTMLPPSKPSDYAYSGNLPSFARPDAMPMPRAFVDPPGLGGAGNPISVSGQVEGQVTVKTEVVPGSALLDVVKRTEDLQAQVRGALAQGPSTSAVSMPQYASPAVKAGPR